MFSLVLLFNLVGHLKVTVLVYLIDQDTSGCSSYVLSWLPEYEYLNRSMLSSKLE